VIDPFPTKDEGDVADVMETVYRISVTHQDVETLWFREQTRFHPDYLVQKEEEVPRSKLFSKSNQEDQEDQDEEDSSKNKLIPSKIFARTGVCGRIRYISHQDPLPSIPILSVESGASNHISSHLPPKNYISMEEMKRNLLQQQQQDKSHKMQEDDGEIITNQDLKDDAMKEDEEINKDEPQVEEEEEDMEVKVPQQFPIPPVCDKPFFPKEKIKQMKKLKKPLIDPTQQPRPNVHVVGNVPIHLRSNKELALIKAEKLRIQQEEEEEELI